MYDFEFRFIMIFILIKYHKFIMTDYIELQRSVRQGCSMSALLFILVMEILAIKIKNDNSITGIRID